MDSTGLKSRAQLQLLIDRIPFAKGLGFFVAKAEGRVVSIGVSPQQQHRNHFGTYQAGVLFALAEITGGLALYTLLSEPHLLIIAKTGKIDFLGNSHGAIFSESELTEDSISSISSTIARHKKLEFPVAVRLKSKDDQLLVVAQITYYIRITARPFELQLQKMQVRQLSPPHSL